MIAVRFSCGWSRSFLAAVFSAIEIRNMTGSLLAVADEPSEEEAEQIMAAQRGQDGNAVDAFLQAETQRPTDPLTSYDPAQLLRRKMGWPV